MSSSGLPGAGAEKVIRLLALDVDGTLTDGSIYIDGNGNEFKRFNVQDGMGIALLRRSGVKVALISGRFSSATETRARELQIDIVINGTENKLQTLKAICKELFIHPEEVVFAGDDINDIECIRWAGKGVAVANARSEVKKAADLVCLNEGGHGAVREVAEWILQDMDQGMGRTDR